MSRVAKNPITLKDGVSVEISDTEITVKGKIHSLNVLIHPLVQVINNAGVLSVQPKSNDGTAEAWMHAGTVRANLNNAVIGLSQGFQKKLQLVGVGYRAQAKGKVLKLTLGFSHPVEFTVPEIVDVETPSQTEIVLSSVDKQALGQCGAEIRAFRSPEPYKGKGVRYADEIIRLKEAKKK